MIAVAVRVRMKVTENVIITTTPVDNESVCELSETSQGDPIKCHGNSKVIRRYICTYLNA